MKGILFIGLMAAFMSGPVSAEQNLSYKWNSRNWFASSTSGIDPGIRPSGDSVTFHLLTARSFREF